MWDWFEAGGPFMWAILLCSVTAISIVAERLWVLRRSHVLPRVLVRELRLWTETEEIDPRLTALKGALASTPLGRIVNVGLRHRHRPREVLKEMIEDTGRHVAHELERFLNTLGTIASISPLLGLLGTVSGMIKVFHVVAQQGSSDPGLLSGGIAEALITTAAGLSVAILSVLCHRYLRGRVDALVIGIEQETLLLVDLLRASPAPPPESAP